LRYSFPVTLLLSLLIGVVAGSRAMMAPAAATWAARLGAIDLAPTPLAFMASPVTLWIFTVLALVELVTDQLPSTPSRTVPVQFGTRLLTGGLSGAAIAAPSGALVAGTPYLIEASGTWRYGENAASSADAECSRAAADGTWRRDRSVHPWDPTSDHLDLYVDGTDLLSDPDTDTGGQCDTATHTYRYVYKPWRSGRVTFATWDPTTSASNGSSPSSASVSPRTVQAF